MSADTTTLRTGLDQLVALVDHVVEGTRNFARGVRGEDIDWSAATPHVEGDRAAVMREAADDLLATALGRPTRDLDPTVAEQGLAFMSQGLTDDNRGEAFGPEQPAPDDADPYERVAAFAGRSVRG